jgi:uncharacterized damage-inducible protein DinB
MSIQIPTLFDYHNWCNGRVLESLTTLDGTDDEPRKLFAHILGSVRMWRTRLTGGDESSLSVWPDLTFEECLVMQAEEELHWRTYLQNLDATELERNIAYRTAKGDDHINRVEEILFQVFNHATYHRSQIALLVRKRGGTPAVTDYIVFSWSQQAVE